MNPLKPLIISAVMLALLTGSLLFFQIHTTYGHSMTPTITEQNCLLIVKPDYTENMENKIITYQYNNTLSVCHRVIQDNIFNLVTQGDNNPTADPKISRSQITGQVSLILPAVAFPLFWITLIGSYLTMLASAGYILYVRFGRHET